MNIKEKQRWSALIKSQFEQLRSDVGGYDSRESYDEEIAAEVKRLGIESRASAIKKKRAELEKAEQELSLDVKKKLKIEIGECGCHESFERVIKNHVSKKVQESRKRKKDDLYKQERKLLAKLELASTEKEIVAIAKEAGLIEAAR